MGFFPSPGQVVSGVGNVMQAAENFVTTAVNTTIDAIQDFADEPTGAASGVTNPNAPQAGAVTLDGVVSRADFDELVRKVAAAFQAVKEDIAALRATGPDGEGGLLYSGDSGGGGMDNNLLLVLALSGGLTGTTTTGTLSPLLLILLLGGGMGGSGGMGLPLMLALGVI